MYRFFSFYLRKLALSPRREQPNTLKIHHIGLFIVTRVFIVHGGCTGRGWHRGLLLLRWRLLLLLRRVLLRLWRRRGLGRSGSVFKFRQRRGFGTQPRVGATLRRILVEIDQMTRHLTGRAGTAPESAATILGVLTTRRGRDLIRGANQLTGTAGDEYRVHEQQQQKDGFHKGKTRYGKDVRQDVEGGGDNEDNLKGGQAGLGGVPKGVGFPIEIHARHDLSDGAGRTTAAHKTVRIELIEAITESVSPLASGNVVRGRLVVRHGTATAQRRWSRRRRQDDGGKALTRRHASRRNLHREQPAAAGVDLELVAFVQVARGDHVDGLRGLHVSLSTLTFITDVMR